MKINSRTGNGIVESKFVDAVALDGWVPCLRDRHAGENKDESEQYLVDNNGDDDNEIYMPVYHDHPSNAKVPSQ